MWDPHAQVSNLDPIIELLSSASGSVPASLCWPPGIYPWQSWGVLEPS